MKYHFRVYKEGKGYWAECLEIEGCVTQASSRALLEVAMKEALDSYLDEPADSAVVFELPNSRHRGANIAEVSPSVRVAFAALLRRTRLAQHKTQREVASAMKIKTLSGYQKLERASSANPTLDTLEKIKTALPEYPIDQLFAH